MDSSEIKSSESDSLPDSCKTTDSDESFYMVNSGSCAEDDSTDNYDYEMDESKLLDWEKVKLTQILEAAEENNIDQLIEFCNSEGGLLSNSVRKIVWPKLIKSTPIAELPDENDMKAHGYYNQVVLDVDRSIKRFPPSIQESQRLSMQDQLVHLIMRILIVNPSLHYYQGFHDICVTFLIILGEKDAFFAMNNLVKTHFKQLMEKTSDRWQFIMELIPVLISRKDPALYDFLEKSEVGNIYALSWMLTWFGHSLNSYKLLGRLFDLFIVNHESFSVYLSAAIVLFKREQILQLECNLAEVYPYLNYLLEKEEKHLPFEQLIQDAHLMMSEYRPESLFGEQLKRVRQKQQMDLIHRTKVSNSGSVPILDRKMIIAASVFAASVAAYAIAKNLTNASN